MNYVKRLLCLVLIIIPSLLHAQAATTSGIKWTTGLSWEQVKQKAKQENKYIFIDAYATWCGPCKAMDKNVYTSDSVGQFFNEKFIAVKVQMDRTKKDDDYVKQWYADADSINNQYHIEGYPTFLFFNSEGQVTEKQMGFKRVGELVAIGKSATTSGKLYDDPYADYNRKVAAYRQGEKNYDQYPSMIKIADKLHDTVLSKQLRKEFTDYAASLPLKERYTKERIEFWNNYTWLSGTKVFGYFYMDATLINKVMGKKNYAENFVDKTIQYEIVFPFLIDQNKGSSFGMDGSYLTYGGKGAAPNAEYREADWQQLGKLILLKYGKDYAKRNGLIARVEWYKRHLNKNAVIEYSLKLFNNYPPDMTDKGTSDMINDPAWYAFLNSTDKRILKGYAKWMKKVVQNYQGDEDYTDTYANLLYKLGYKKKAIKWEEKAVKFNPNDGTYSRTLDLMKKDMPTYLDLGAIWPK